MNTIVDTIEVKANPISGSSGTEEEEPFLINIIMPSIIILSGTASISILVNIRKRKVGKGWMIPK